MITHSRLTYSFRNQTARAEKAVTQIKRNMRTGLRLIPGSSNSARPDTYGTSTPNPPGPSMNAARIHRGSGGSLTSRIKTERLHTTGQERDAGVSRHCLEEGQTDGQKAQDEPLPEAG